MYRRIACLRYKGIERNKRIEIIQIFSLDINLFGGFHKEMKLNRNDRG